MNNRLARKVSMSKWNNQIENKSKVVSADAITSCLKTKDNTLSVWCVENVEDAVLALACVNTSISPIDILEFTKERLGEISIEISAVKATNPVADLVNKHYDIINLNYNSLGIIANEIANETIKNSTFITRYSKPKVKKIIEQAITDGRVNVVDLPDNLQKNFK